MFSDRTREKLIWLLIAIGFTASLLASVENRVGWVSSLCSFMGSGCRETEHVTLLNVPVAFWGILYYIILSLVAYFSRQNLFVAIVAGAGFEMTLISAMVEMKLVCFFCLVNLCVVTFLILLTFDQPRVWQALALTFLFFLVSDHLLLTSKVRSGPPVTRAPEPSVVATVGGTSISQRDLEGPLSTRIYKLNSQIYMLKKERLDFLVNTRLIELDALEKGLSPEIMTYKIMVEGIDVSDEEVEAYYRTKADEFREWRGTPDELKGRIRRYLMDRKTAERVDAYTRPLREKYPVSVFLTAPPLPITSVSEGDSPALGPADAPVTVVEYSDYQCPACRKAHEIVKKIRGEYTGRVRWIYKNYPLDRHRNARFMAQAAHCADEQGKFWEFQDMLFQSKKNVDAAAMKKFGDMLGLDARSFGECVDTGRYQPLVEKDKREGREAGVSSTPTFIINGQISPGYLKYEAFKDLIEKELAKDYP